LFSHLDIGLLPTMPFARDEMIYILVALEPYGKSASVRNAQTAASLRLAAAKD
jgi:hypothetical protein